MQLTNHMIRSSAHDQVHRPTNIKLACKAVTTITVATNTVNTLLGNPWSTVLSEIRDDILVVTPSIYHSPLKSNYRLTIVAEELGDDTRYSLENTNGTKVPFSSFFDAGEEVTLGKLLSKFEEAATAAGYSAGHPVQPGTSLSYRLVFEPNSVTYSCMEECRTFYEISSPVAYYTSASKRDENELLNNLLKKQFYGETPRVSLEKVERIHDRYYKNKSQQSQLDTRLVPTKGRGGGCKDSSIWMGQNSFPKCIPETTDLAAKMLNFSESILMKVDKIMTVFFLRWTLLQTEGKNHPEFIDDIQNKLDLEAVEALSTFKWWAKTWLTPILKSANAVLTEKFDPALAALGKELHDQMVKPIHLLTVSSIPLDGMHSYAVQIPTEYSEEAFKLFDLDSINDLISSIFEYPAVVSLVFACQRSILIADSSQELASRLPGVIDKCQLWEKSTKPVSFLMRARDLIKTTVHNYTTSNAEVYDTRTNDKIGNVKESATHTFKYQGYIVALEPHRLTWSKVDSTMAEGEHKLLGISHWTKPYRVGSRLYYLCNDIDHDPDTQERQLKINLIAIELAPLANGNKPEMVKLCQVLAGVRATSCDLVANEKLIVMTITSFLSEKYVCVASVSKNSLEITKPIQILTFEEVEPLKGLDKIECELSANKINVEIRSMQFYGDFLMAVVEDYEQYQDRTQRLYCMQWNNAIGNFKHVDSILLAKHIPATLGSEFSGIAWLARKSVPYILNISGPSSITVITMHHRKLVKIRQSRIAFKLPVTLHRGLSFSKQFDYCKKSTLTIAVVSGDLGTPEKLISISKLSLGNL